MGPLQLRRWVVPCLGPCLQLEKVVDSCLVPLLLEEMVVSMGLAQRSTLMMLQDSKADVLLGLAYLNVHSLSQFHFAFTPRDGCRCPPNRESPIHGLFHGVVDKTCSIADFAWNATMEHGIQMEEHNIFGHGQVIDEPNRSSTVILVLCFSSCCVDAKQHSEEVR